MIFDYFYGKQADQFAFYRVPKMLFAEEKFWNVSTDANVAFRAKCKIFSRHLQKPILKTEKGRFKGL